MTGELAEEAVPCSRSATESFGSGSTLNGHDLMLDSHDLWPCRVVTEEQLAEIVAKVDKAEAECQIAPWEAADVPTSLLEDEPEPGTIVSEEEVPDLGGVDLTLSNGMKVSRNDNALGSTSCKAA